MLAMQRVVHYLPLRAIGQTGVLPAVSCAALCRRIQRLAYAAVSKHGGLGEKYSNLGQLEADAKPLLSPQVGRPA
jgi:hypothetical protein